MRKTGTLPWLRPDGKSQVTVEYHYGKPVRVDTVLVSTQHAPEIIHADIREGVIEHVINPVLPPEMVDKDAQDLRQPHRALRHRRPMGDAGRDRTQDHRRYLRRHGPPWRRRFSGKDPTKVDRSAAYAARWAAKNIVAAGIADRCEIQVAYAIGVAHPLSINVETFGTGKIADEKIARLIERTLRPAPRRDHP